MLFVDCRYLATSVAIIDQQNIGILIFSDDTCYLTIVVILLDME